MGSGASKARTEEETFEEVARTLSKAKRITVFSGAGVSVSSGIPDFRSPGGIWTRFDPMVYCDYENFLDKPEMFWTMVKCLYQDIHFSLGGSRGTCPVVSCRVVCFCSSQPTTCSLSLC
mmetsp:Transcript_3800/g.10922  ORF Transcript_3800/g.10922 Transcript_3800/m.10922 type:complete len:119 (+) Transcript_3800:269-625(+)